MVDFKKLSLAELRLLKSDIERALVRKRQDEKAAAKEELESRAQELGYSLEGLLGLPARMNKKRPASAKYANPADPTQTWTGRGRKPKWFLAHIRAGRDPEDLLLK